MPGFHALGAAWLFALIAPLVLLYFLKLRRPRAEISSLVLWRRVLDDDRVNAPFQRFKRSLLFWLQLVLLLLLAVAAMQPFFRGENDTAERVPLIVDCSASMAALDEAGGETRLDAAKRRAIELIDNLSSDQAACVIGFSGRARQVTGFTRDRRRLLDAVRSLEIEDEPGRIEGALRLAEALAKTSPFDRVHLITDGNLPASVDFALPFDLSMESLVPAGRNVGISACSARRGADSEWELFVSIDATAEYAGTVSLRLLIDGKAISDRSVSFRGESSKGVVFRVSAEDDVIVEASLVPDGFDALGVDDRAWISLPRPRPLRVSVGSGLAAFSAALRGMEGIELVADDPDVVIAAKDAETDCAVGLFVDALPPDVEALFDEKEGEVSVVDWDRAAALLAHVDLAEIVVFVRRGWKVARGVMELEARGYRVYVHGDRLPLMIGRTDRDVERYYLLFEPSRSTLPYRLGFPVLVMNLIRIAQARAGLLDAEGARTGVLPDAFAAGGTAVIAAGREYRIDGPGGGAWRRRASEGGRLSGIPAPKVGAYVVRDGSEEVATVHCALLSAAETRLGRVERLQFDERLTVEAAAPPPAERPLWPWLAAIAFGVLLVEWWFYQRRAGAPA